MSAVKRAYYGVQILACLIFLPHFGFSVAEANEHRNSLAFFHEHHNHSKSESAKTESSSEKSHDQKGEANPWQYQLLGFYCLLIVVASLIGGWLPSRINLTHDRMQTLISFVGGLMLGIGLFHLLPHSIHEIGSIDQSIAWMMAGIVSMFLLIRAFHVHHHGPVELPGESQTVVDDSYQFRPQSEHEHDHDCDGHSHGHHHHAHRLSWIGITFGLCLHTLIDGIALGAHVSADAEHEVLLSLFGLGTFLGVLLHKPLDAISITSLMAVGGWSARSRYWVNFGFSLMCPLGAILFVLGIQQFDAHQTQIVGSALAFAAGVFLCISLGDLLPEMEFHSHHRVRLTLALLLGIFLAYGITFLEPEHMHG
ncbi:MAG: ZIP family metal transporter [Planctomycetaceae bacterium]